MNDKNDQLDFLRRHLTANVHELIPFLVSFLPKLALNLRAC